jgi:hypothetical protein
MSDLQQTLRELHRELGEADRLAPEDRAMLETVLDDIQRALQSSEPAYVAAEAPGDVLEGAAVRLEAGHPGLAATVRSVIDALSRAGI